MITPCSEFDVLFLNSRVWWPIVAKLNLNHRRNLKPYFHYITLKFKTEIKYNKSNIINPLENNNRSILFFERFMTSIYGENILAEVRLIHAEQLMSLYNFIVLRKNKRHS